MMIKDKKWPDDFHNRFFIGMHTVDCDQNGTIPGLLSRMDPRDIIKRLADAGVDAVYFYSSCHCGNCFYPTETPLAHMHTGLNGRDVFGEAADECQKRGMAFIAVYEYMNLRIKEFGPREWQHYYPVPAPGNGSTSGYCGLCWNTGYGEFVAHQLEEVSRRYPISGFYVDMLNHPGLVCCEGCARRFKEIAGVAPPREIADTPLYKAFKLWTYEEESRYLRELRKIIRTHQPVATMINNILLFHCEDLYEVPAANDYISHDTTIVFGSRRGGVYQSALLATYRSMARGQPAFEVLSDPILYGCLSVAPDNTYNAVTSLVRLQGGVAGYPSSMLDRVGELNEAVLGLAEDANEFLNDRRPWPASGEPVRFAGLYLSQESEIFHANPDPRKSDRAPYLNSFLGAYLAAQREHLPVDVLTRRDLKRLAEYPVLILANTVCMSDEEVEAVREYVRAGGTLIATFETSLRNEWAEPRPDFALADVFGVDCVGSVILPFNALQLPLPADRFPTEKWEHRDVTMAAPGLVCKAHPGAEVIVNLHDRYRRDPERNSGAMQNAYTRIEPAGPGIVVNRVGRGRCIYCSGKIFNAYLNTGVPTLRKLLMRWLIEPEITGQCLLRLNAPSSVEMTAWAQPDENRMLVHMVNYQSAPGRYQTPESGDLPITEDVLPVCDLELIVKFRPEQLRAAFLRPSGLTLEMRPVGDGTLVRIPKVCINEIVELNFQPGVCPVYPVSNECFDYQRLDWRGKIAAWLKTNPPEYNPEDDGAADFSQWLPAEVFLTEWSVLGLFVSSGMSDLLAGEVPDMDAVYAGDDGGKVSWQPMRGPGHCPDGCVELAAKCGNRKNTVGYAITFLKSEKDQEVLFRLGNDDACEIYLNGERVFLFEGMEKPCFIPDQHAFSATLRAGLNTLLVKKTQIGHGYKFHLRVDKKPAYPVRCMHRPDADGRELVVHEVEQKEWDGRGAGQE